MLTLVVHHIVQVSLVVSDKLIYDQLYYSVKVYNFHKVYDDECDNRLDCYSNLHSRT